MESQRFTIITGADAITGPMLAYLIKEVNKNFISVHQYAEGKGIDPYKLGIDGQIKMILDIMANCKEPELVILTCGTYDALAGKGLLTAVGGGVRIYSALLNLEQKGFTI